MRRSGRTSVRCLTLGAFSRDLCPLCGMAGRMKVWGVRNLTPIEDVQSITAAISSPDGMGSRAPADKQSGTRDAGHRKPPPGQTCRPCRTPLIPCAAGCVCVKVLCWIAAFRGRGLLLSPADLSAGPACPPGESGADRDEAEQRRRPGFAPARPGTKSEEKLGEYHNEGAPRSRSSLRSPHEPLEPQDEALHLRGTQRYLHY